LTGYKRTRVAHDAKILLNWNNARVHHILFLILESISIHKLWSADRPCLEQGPHGATVDSILAVNKSRLLPSSFALVHHKHALSKWLTLGIVQQGVLEWLWFVSKWCINVLIFTCQGVIDLLVLLVSCHCIVYNTLNGISYAPKSLWCFRFWVVSL